MNKCLSCEKETTNPKFCNRSCSAKYTNKLYPKRTKEKICKLCNKLILSNRLYCKECYKISLSKRKKEESIHICSYCNKNENETRIKPGYKGAKSNICVDCYNTRLRNKRNNLKKLCLDYRGNSCEICGYNKCNMALEFHHKDPKEKDFNISRISRWTLNEKIIKELDKCIVVCSNCHREIHSKE